MRIGILCNDARMKQVKKNLEEDYECIDFFENLDVFSTLQADALIFPVHGVSNCGEIKTAKGMVSIPYSTWENYRHKPIFIGTNSAFFKNFQCVYNYMKFDSLKQINAYYTAEGVLYLILDNTSKSLKDLTVDVIGYGLCGKEIVSLLNQLQVNTRIIRRNCKEENNFISIQTYHKLEPADVIVYTAIGPLFQDSLLLNWKKRPFIIDISSETVLNESFLKRCGIRYLKAKSLPSMIAYESAGNAIANSIKEVLYDKK